MRFKRKDIDIFVRAKALRWKNRRQLAFIAIFSMLFVMYWCMFKMELERLPKIEEIVIWFLMIQGSIVGAYMGFSTFDDKWQEEYRKSRNIIREDMKDAEAEIVEREG